VGGKRCDVNGWMWRFEVRGVGWDRGGGLEV
jgi:hypothetical protein